MVFTVRRIEDEEQRTKQQTVNPSGGFVVRRMDDAVPVDEELTRASDPFKQGIAGVTDIATGVPALLGLAGGGLEAGLNTILNDQGFATNWEDAISSGMDASLLQAGMSGREAVNEFLGIKDPVSAEDQAARILGNFIPIPGLPIISGASKLANASRHLFNILTPAVRLERTSTRPFRDKLVGKVIDGTLLNRRNATRIAAQLGIGGVLEQGIRGVIDDPAHPLILSDTALYGIPINNPLITDEAIIEDRESRPDFSPWVDEEGTLHEYVSGSSGDTELEGGSQGDRLIKGSGFVIRRDPEYISEGVAERREMDLRIDKADSWDGVKTFALIAAVATGSIAAIKFSQRIAHKTALDNAPLGPDGIPSTPLGNFAAGIDPFKAGNLIPKNPVTYLAELPGHIRRGGSDAGTYITEQWVDSGNVLSSAAQEVGFTKQTADHLQGNSHMDPIGMETTVWDTGAFGQGTSLQTHSGRQLEVEYGALGDTKRIFDQFMLATTLRATGPEDVAPGHLWKVGKTTDELDAMIAAGKADKRVTALANKFYDVFDTHLDYQVARGILTKAEAKAFRAKSSVAGKLTYMPLYTASRKGFMNRLARRVGIKTTEGQKHVLMGEYHTRGLDGISIPLTPMKALRQYSIHSINNANTAAFHRQALFHLAGVDVNAGVVTRFFVDDRGKRHSTTTPSAIRHTARDTAYIGKGQITDQTERIKIDIDKDAPNRFTEGTVGDLEKDFPNEIITVQHQGELLAFHVPDKGLRAALDLNPQLGAGLHFMNHWKGVFTKFTTGELSLFAPISHLFSAQQIAINTAARQKGHVGSSVWAGVKSFGESALGTKELLMAEASQEIAQFLAFRLATKTGVAKMAPEMTQKIATWTAKRFADSMVNPIRGETGRIASSLQASTFTGSVDDFAAATGVEFGKLYGQDQMGLVWRLWKTFNTALHEGPAFGAMQKHIGDARIAGKTVDAKVIREAVDYSKTVAGDMRRLGASDMAKRFNASVPFSAAMIQSWASIGSAATHGGMESFGKFVAGVGAIIGVPTVSEMIYNTLLSAQTNPDGSPLTFTDESGKAWTYDDYYWNGYTTQQRADNMIMFVPGQPPWEAILMPISPEWGLFRGAVMDAVDAAFNLSNVGAIHTADPEQNRIARTQLVASAARVLDIPLPPLVAAAYSAVGADVRLGLAVEESSDPDDPGAGLTLLRNVPLGQGERITRRAGKAKYALSHLDTTTVAMLQDIFGAGGSLYVAAYEAFHAGKTLDSGSITTGLADAAVAFGDGLRKQARYTQPLWGKTLRPSAGGEIATDLFNRRAALNRLATDFKQYYQGGKGNLGNTVIPPDDPINFELSADAKKVLSTIGKLDSHVSLLRRELASMGNATNLGTISNKNASMDAKRLQIQALKAQQLGFIIDYEARVSSVLSERYGREIDINLATFKPRANLVGDSIFQGFLKPRQTSQ